MDCLDNTGSTVNKYFFKKVISLSKRCDRQAKEVKIIFIVQLPDTSIRKKLQKAFKYFQSWKEHDWRLTLGRRCSVLDELHLQGECGCRDPTLGQGHPSVTAALGKPCQGGKENRSKKQWMKNKKDWRPERNHHFLWITLQPPNLLKEISHPHGRGSPSSSRTS